MPSDLLDSGTPSFLDWLKARYLGDSWRHYWHYARLIAEGQRIVHPSSHSASSEQKTRTAMLRWSIEVGRHLPTDLLPVRLLSRRARALSSLGQPLSVKRRQRTVMDLLASGESSLPLAEIGRILLADAKSDVLVPRLTARARLEVRKWTAIRNRLIALPAEARRHRVSAEWAQSPFLFPAPSGGPSRVPQMRGRRV